MAQLQYSTGTFRISRTPSVHTPRQRAVGIAFAAAIEAAIIYTLLVALGYVEAPSVRPPIQVVNVAPLPNEPEIPLPPPQIFEAPPIERAIAPVVELTYTPPAPPTAISLPPPLPVPPAPRDAAPPAPPAAFTPARAITASHTTPDYPFLSRRLNEQGTLRLKLSIDEKGTVTEAFVVNSSGFARLDEAAVEWVKAHWRYMPAMQGTKPVPSMAQAVVEFRLQ